MIPFLCGTQNNPIQRQKINDCQGLGGNGDLLLNGCRILVWEDQNILEMHGGDSCTPSMYLMLLNCIHKMAKIVNFMLYIYFTQ